MHCRSKSRAGLSNPFFSLEALLTSLSKHFWRLTFLLLLDTKPIDIQGLLIYLLKTEKHVHFQAQTQRERKCGFLLSSRLWGRALRDYTVFLKLVSDVECQFSTSRCFAYKLFFAEMHNSQWWEWFFFLKWKCVPSKLYFKRTHSKIGRTLITL